MIKYCLALYVLFLILSGCKKENTIDEKVIKNDPPIVVTDTTTTPTDTTTTTNDTVKVATRTHLHLEFNPLVESAPLVYGAKYADSSGRTFTISAAQFYVSGITITKSDGTELSFSSVYLMVKPAIKSYAIDSLPYGDYKSISFNVGVDASKNDKHQEPTVYPDGSALGVQSPSMYWTWTDLGYIFMKVQGMVDTSATNSGTANYPFSANIGTDALLKRITLNKPFTIDKLTNTIGINVHFDQFFKGYALRNIKTDTGDNPTQSQKLSVNIEKYMFEMK